jgi:hypothetical protein
MVGACREFITTPHQVYDYKKFVGGLLGYIAL